ncbi:MAG: hypothetical protein AMXMBFR84_23080 [Candidatus Hydrogenedentota bacterium]
MSDNLNNVSDDRVEQVRAKGSQYLLRILNSVVKQVFQYRKTAIVTAVLVFAFFLQNSIRHGYTYSATAAVVLNPPAYQEEGPASKLIPEPLDVPSYARILREDAVLDEALKIAAANDPELWKDMEADGKLVAQSVRDWCVMSTEISQKTPQTVIYSKVIKFSVRAPKPEMAKGLLDAWMETAAETVRGITLPGTTATIEYIRGEYEKAKTELAGRESELLKEQTAFNVPRLKLLKEERERQLGVLKNNLDLARVELESSRAEALALQEQLTQESKTIELHRIPSVDAQSIADAIKKASSGNPIRYLDEAVNSAWVQISSSEAEVSGRVKGQESQVAQLEASIAAIEDEITDLNGQFVANDLKQKQMLREITASETYFTSLAALRESVAALEANTEMERASVITLAAPAVLPTEPDNFLVRWGALPMGALLALIAGIAAANALYEWDRFKKSNEPETQHEG